MQSERFDSLTEAEAEAVEWDWEAQARPAQLPPDTDWRTWLVLAGRGFGKTRTGAEWVRDQIETKGVRRIGVIAPTAADARDVMIEGESGILAVCPPWNRPVYEPSKRRLTWPNGAIVTAYSADRPDRLRGPQHEKCWCDEVGAWRYPAAWDMMMMGLRLGGDPQVCVTTTPKPTKLVRDLMAAKTTAKTGGSTFDNRANLAPQFIDQIVSVYEGTRLGLQEIYAELSEIAEGAWFPQFSTARHVSAAAEYDPRFPVTLAVDCGVSGHTGAVFFQVLPDPSDPYRAAVRVFGDYYAAGLYSEANATAIRALSVVLCGGRLDRVRLDPASTARTGVGPAAYGEYERVFGRRMVSFWPRHLVSDGLDLVETMLGSEAKAAEILIHPRAAHLIDAFKNYQHANVGGEWQSYPRDPAHPEEDLMDSLRGGLTDHWPAGRRPDLGLHRSAGARVMY